MKNLVTYDELKRQNPNSKSADIAFKFLFTRPAADHKIKDLLEMRDVIWMASQSNINLLLHLDPINTELNRRSSNKTFFVSIILSIGAIILAATGPVLNLISYIK